MFLAIEAAFCSAERVTIAGSISPVMASRPWPFLGLRASLTMTEPSIFGLCAIRRSGSSSARSAIYAPSRPPSGTRRDGRRSQPAARCRHRDRCPARAPRGASATPCLFSFSSVSVAPPTFTPRDTAGQRREALLRLFAVEVRVGVRRAIRTAGSAALTGPLQLSALGGRFGCSLTNPPRSSPYHRR